MKTNARFHDFHGKFVDSVEVLSTYIQYIYLHFGVSGSLKTSKGLPK